MRILLVTQYFLPQPLANAEVIGGLADALTARGHVVDVVTPVAGTSATRLHRHRAFGYFATDRSSIPARVVEYATFTAGALLAGLRTPRPDVILVPSPPPTLGLVGLALGAIRRVPFVYNVQDLYPEVAVATGTVRPGLALRALGRVIALVYRRAAAVVVIDPRFVPAIRQAASGAHVVPIRNGVDQRVLLGADADPRFLDDIGAPRNTPVVMYAGNVGRSQDLEAVARATATTGATFVVHGSGAGLDDLMAAAATNGWNHVRFSPYRDRAELGTVFASADLHVVPLRAGIASASVPSKLLSIFSAGRPAVVMAEADSAVADVLDESGGGWLVRPGDEEALTATIELALADGEELTRRGSAARAWATEGASMERVAREYESALIAAMR